MANQVHLRPVDSPLAEIARLGVELAGPRTEAVIVVDLDGRVVAWNNHATELFGWTAEEAIGRTTVEVMGRQEDEAEMDEISRGLAQGEAGRACRPRPRSTARTSTCASPPGSCATGATAPSASSSWPTACSPSRPTAAR